jgi:hypothetical protein
VLREIFGVEWDEVAGEWRKVHSEELYDLYSSLNDQIEKKLDVQGVQHVWGERRAEFRILIGQSEGRRMFGRPRYGWDGNIINGS